MNEIEKKEEILEEAFAQFSERGIGETKIDDIAAALKVSKKTIYAHFKSKIELLEEACRWKLTVISSKAQKVVETDTCIISKFIMYLEIIVNDVNDISVKMTNGVLEDRERLMKIVNDYLKGAVYERFSFLMEQGKSEGKINIATDPAASLIIYWETLSTFLFARPDRHIPEEFRIKKPIYQLFGDQMVNFFRGLLNEEGIRDFDNRLSNHPRLNQLFG
ncbi:MAG: TetR/AcrR family transcriptional regulator [Cyclobacteriaceae bacterium]